MMMKKGKTIQIRVQVLMNNHLQIYGDITIADGYRSRVSDLLNDERKFLPLTNVVFQGPKSKSPNRSNFLCINKDAVVFLAEQEQTSRKTVEGEEEEEEEVILEVLK